MLAAAVDFGAASSGDVAQVADFLRRSFDVHSDAEFLDPRHLAWKYWCHRDDWSGSRSFAARRDGRIVGHVAAWPIRIQLPDAIVPAVHLIDWASDPAHPGLGIWLLRKMGARTPLLIATGGTDLTRRALPAIGFKPFGTISTFARPVRPLGQLRTAERSWRTPARLMRNAIWRLSTPLSAVDDWSATPVAADRLDASEWPKATDSMAATHRDASFYQYILSSPLTPHVLFRLMRRRSPMGFFCLAYARHVARIADLWVASTGADDWTAAVRTAAAVAARGRDVHEVTAWTSTTIGREAFVRAGFRERDTSTLSLFGQCAALQGRELHVQMVDCDASYLLADEVRYLT